MAKLQLAAAPTFKTIVQIPVPGSKPVGVEFTFKGRTKAEFNQFVADLDSGAMKEDVDVLMSIASGWELDDPFDRESVSKLIENYIGSWRAVVQTYIQELTAARAKN